MVTTNARLRYTIMQLSLNDLGQLLIRLRTSHMAGCDLEHA